MAEEEDCWTPYQSIRGWKVSSQLLSFLLLGFSALMTTVPLCQE